MRPRVPFWTFEELLGWITDLRGWSDADSKIAVIRLTIDRALGRADISKEQAEFLRWLLWMR